MSASDAQKKLEKINAEIEKVKAEKLALNPHKERKRIAPAINHAEKPKKSFSHPKLDFIYGEILSSPYLTPPLDPYPKEVFSTVNTLRELKRQGVKAIADLPRDRQPYNPKKHKNLFIREVVNYEVSFLPKGYEEKKEKERAAAQRELEWEENEQHMMQEILGKDQTMPVLETLRPVSAPKTHTLLGNISRGGPEKYKKDLLQLRKRRMGMTQAQRVKEIQEKFAAVEDEARRQRLAADHAKDLSRRLKASAREREVLVDDDIHRFKSTAYRIKRSQVTRMDRVSSPPHLLRRRFLDMDEEDYNKRGRSRSPLRMRSQSPDGTGRSINTGTLPGKMSQSIDMGQSSLRGKLSGKQNNNKNTKKPAYTAPDTPAVEVALPPAFEITAMNETYDDDFDAPSHTPPDFNRSIAYEQPNFSAFDDNQGEYGSIEDVAEEFERPATGGRGTSAPSAADASEGVVVGRQNKKSSNVTSTADEDFPEYEAEPFEDSSAPVSRGAPDIVQLTTETLTTEAVDPPAPAPEESVYAAEFEDDDKAVPEAEGKDSKDGLDGFSSLSVVNDRDVPADEGKSDESVVRSSNNNDDDAKSSYIKAEEDKEKEEATFVAVEPSVVVEAEADAESQGYADIFDDITVDASVTVIANAAATDAEQVSVDATESFASAPASFTPNTTENTDTAPFMSADV